MFNHKLRSIYLLITLFLLPVLACGLPNHGVGIGPPQISCRPNGELMVHYSVGQAPALEVGDEREPHGTAFTLNAGGNSYQEITVNGIDLDPEGFGNQAWEVEFTIPSPTVEEELTLLFRMTAESWQTSEAVRSDTVSVPHCEFIADSPLNVNPWISCSDDMVHFNLDFSYPVYADITLYSELLNLSVSAEYESDDLTYFAFGFLNPIEDNPHGIDISFVIDEDTGEKHEIFHEIYHVDRRGCISSNDEPYLESITCLPNGQMMINFNFYYTVTGKVTGEYEAIVNSEVWELSSSSGGDRLIFIGPAVEGGTKPEILLQTLPDHSEYYKETGYSVKACDSPPLELQNPDGTPEIINTMCVGKGESKQLMIVFEFEQDVMGQYEVFVNDVQYKQEIVAHPRRLFFFGTAPPDGGMPHILVQSLPNHAVVFDVTDYEVPQCNVERHNDGGGDGDYVPPPINE